MSKKDKIKELVRSGEFSDSNSPTQDIADEVECSRSYVRQVKKEIDQGSEDENNESENHGDKENENSSDNVDNSDESDLSGDDRESGDSGSSDSGSEPDSDDGSGDKSLIDYDSVEEFKNDSHSCDNCGTEVEFGVTYCPDCGRGIAWDKAVQKLRNKLESEE